MTNFDSSLFRAQIDFIILNLRGLPILIDHLKSLEIKYQFDKSEELEYDYIFNILTKEYLDIKLEQFFNNFNLKEAELTYDSNQQVKLTTTKEYAGLFVTDADLNNFSCEGKYILNRLVVKLCFLARFIDNVFKHSDSKESDVDLIQADFIELKKAIEDLIEELVRTTFVSQELKDMTHLLLWPEKLLVVLD